MTNQCEVIIVAGGQGRRMGAAEPKAFLELEGRRIITYTIEVFANVPEVSGIILVVPSGMEEQSKDICSNCKGSEKLSAIVTGGARRQDSVRAGMDQLNPATEIVLIQDAARIFTTEALIKRVITGAIEFDAAIPGVPVADTLKRVDEACQVSGTVERRQLMAIQTPQGFKRPILEKAYQYAWENQIAATDDAGLVETSGQPVKVVDGERFNFKLTTPRDLEMAIAILRSRNIQGWRKS